MLPQSGVCLPRLWSWWEKQIFQREFQEFTAPMPLLVSSEHSCCLWLGQSKYFYSSVVLENDVYSSPGDGSQPRLNTVFDCFVFSLQWVVCVGFAFSLLVWAKWNFYRTFFSLLLLFVVFLASHHWFAATVKLLGHNQHPSESLLHVCGGSWRVQGKTLHLRDQTGAQQFNHLSASHGLSRSAMFEASQSSSRHEKKALSSRH